MNIFKKGKEKLVKAKEKIFNRKKDKKGKDPIKRIDDYIDNAEKIRDQYEIGSKEYEHMTNEIDELLKRRIEAEEMKSRKKTKVVEIFIGAVIALFTIRFKKFLFKEGLEFEKDNTIGSTTIRSILFPSLNKKD